MEKQEEVTSLQCNFAPLLLRKKTVLYPDGRTSYKFKNYLRGKVTVFDKNTGEIKCRPGEDPGTMNGRKRKQQKQQKLENPMEPETAPEEEKKK